MTNIAVLKPSDVLPPLKTERDTKPTAKQMAALKYIVGDGMSKRAAMIKAGYSVSTANVAKQKLMQKKGTQDLLASLNGELVNKGITIEKLAEKFSEWIDAKKIHGSMTEPDQEVPDYEVQIKAYDRIAKIKGLETPQAGKIKRQLTVTEFIGVNENQTQDE